MEQIKLVSAIALQIDFNLLTLATFAAQDVILAEEQVQFIVIDALQIFLWIQLIIIAAMQIVHLSIIKTLI